MEGRTLSAFDVPERGDPDRKRVLNVLAQRRYRTFLPATADCLYLSRDPIGQRRKERIQALESQTETTVSETSVPEIPMQSSSAEAQLDSGGHLRVMHDNQPCLSSEAQAFWILNTSPSSQLGVNNNNDRFKRLSLPPAVIDPETLYDPTEFGTSQPRDLTLIYLP
jgi:hypothetical protein